MPSALRRPRPKLVSTTKAPFPSPRQARCNGLKKHLYPPYIQYAIDYDYADKLSDSDRAWLAAFSEERYMGWRKKNETQIHPLEQLREANKEHACRQRRRGDPLSGVLVPIDPQNDDNSPHGGESAVRLLAAQLGKDAHELQSGNVVEDAMVRWLDRPKRVK